MNNDPFIKQQEPFPVILNDPLQSKPSRIPVILSSVILMTLLAVAGYLFYQNQLLMRQVEVLKNSLESKPAITANSQEDEFTALNDGVDKDLGSSSWQTFVTSNNFSIVHPPDWTIETTPMGEWTNETPYAELSISKGDHKISIQFLSGYGPGTCIFEDHTDFAKEFEDDPIFNASKCPGKFVEFEGADSTYRRKAEPNSMIGESDKQSWPVYSKDETGNFVTVPPITYLVPKSYSMELVALMDQIVASFKSVK